MKYNEDMLNKYENDKVVIYYKLLDKQVICDIEKAVLDGYNKILEYFAIQYNKEIIVYVYSSIEELHLDVFGSKKEEWGVLCFGEHENIIKVVSPTNPGKVHDYDTILKIISKSVADAILNDNFKNILRWFDITSYIVGLNTETSTNSDLSIIKFRDKNYYNFSDCYFITRYILEKFGKNALLEILKYPNKYNEILKLSDEEIDNALSKHYS